MRKYIGKGGYGSEAEIEIELRTEFPGIGGTIYTNQALPVALRIDHNQTPGIGHHNFYKHAILKKLEDYFFVKGEYGYAHITRPLGSTEELYIYEWAFGRDGFPWYYTDNYREISVNLDDWNEFLSVFQKAGVDMQQDCTDPEYGRISQNVVHQLMEAYTLKPEWNCLWKRIDFGDRSVRIDYDKLKEFLEGKKDDLQNTLHYGRYDMMKLSLEYILKGGSMSEKDLGRLEILTLDYRLSTLRHLNTRGVEISGQGRDITLHPE